MQQKQIVVRARTATPHRLSLLQAKNNLLKLQTKKSPLAMVAKRRFT
jgi:hypothetical protein